MSDIEQSKSVSEKWLFVTSHDLRPISNLQNAHQIETSDYFDSKTEGFRYNFYKNLPLLYSDNYQNDVKQTNIYGKAFTVIEIVNIALIRNISYCPIMSEFNIK